jgi:uncharacterized protein YegJ (DUF2314 family)
MALAQASEPDPIIEVDSTDAKMNAAMAEAQATIDEWLIVLEEQPEGYGDIAFKFPLEGWEHIWVGNVAREGDMLWGTLSNSPHTEGWAFGDVVSVAISDVTDWAYSDDRGVMQGHRTTRVMFDQLDPALVAQLKRDYGWD